MCSEGAKRSVLHYNKQGLCAAKSPSEAAVFGGFPLWGAGRPQSPAIE